MKLKKALSSFLVLVLLLSCMSVTAFAESTEPWANGATPASNQIFYIAESEYSISDDNYDSDNSTYDSVSKKGILAFKQNLTKIVDGWFYNANDIIELIFPVSVTHLESSAIYTAHSLKSISMPGVTTYGDNAINCCGELEFVYARQEVEELLASTSGGIHPVTISGTNGTVHVGPKEVEGCILYVMTELNVAVTATPDAGYKLDSLTATYQDGDSVKNLEITDGSFKMPTAAVTVNAVFSEIQTTGTSSLDLETSTEDIPESKAIDQYYQKTEGSNTVYNHRIGVYWWTDAYTTLNHKNLVIQVNDAKKWDPSSLTWAVDDALNGVASVQEGTNKVNFTLTNYSAKAFTCTISYTKNEGDDKTKTDGNTVTFDSNNGKTLAKVENDISLIGVTNEAYLTDGVVDLTKVPTLTITGTVGVDLDAFKNAGATTSAAKYGYFTITCTAVND